MKGGEDLEDKQKICDLLCETLKKTRDAWDVESLNLDDSQETCTILFENGYRRYVNVACDSGVAMIKDIMKGLGV